MKTTDETISWLLQGDVSIVFQAWRDLLHEEKPVLRRRIEKEGWGKTFLSLQHQDGHWGSGFYSPKWISTHYTLLDLRYLSISPNNPAIGKSVNHILRNEKGPDGGINPSGSISKSDVCINGMALNYCAYFQADEDLIKPVIDFILGSQMKDGGFNCHFNRKGAVHSSLHSTLSILEGMQEYRRNKYSYRILEIQKAELLAREFVLMHRLFRSDKTGNIIKTSFLQFHYPGRWYYDILKAMDYFQYARVKYDVRMDDSIEIILKKRAKDGRWKLAAHHPGQTHFEMEKAGQPSRWNTLRALRVLECYG